MSAALHQPFASSEEMLAVSLAVDGGDTITVSLPAPLIAHIRTVCSKCGRSLDDWLYQAAIERVARQRDELQRVLQHRRGPDVEVVTSPTINAIDRIVKHCVAAAHAAGDDREVDRLLTRHRALKRQIENLAPSEREIVAGQALRELQAEVVP